MVGKNELNSLESYLIAIIRNSHLRLLWWSQEPHHMSWLSAFWYLLGLLFCMHSELWHGPKPHISMAKASLIMVGSTFWKNFMKPPLSLPHCLPIAVMVLEANAEMKFPSAWAPEWPQRSQASGQATLDILIYSSEWEINSLS